jgi:hypothetical protein
VLTNVFSTFLGDTSVFPTVSECDNIFTGNDELEKQLFCRAIKQTIIDFEATGIDWNKADETFPFICSGGPNGAARSQTVCNICTTIRDAYVNNGGNPNFQDLTEDILFDVIQPQDACDLSIGGRNRFGQHACNYVQQINSDFTCNTWSLFVSQDPRCTTLTPEQCFNTVLQSKLIQGASLRLYDSIYCEKEMNTYTGRMLADVDVVPEGVVV